MLRFASAAAFIALLFSPVALAGGPFTDVDPANPAASAAAYFHDRGVLQGFADGTFRPDNHLNRAEVAKIITLLSGSGRVLSECRRPGRDFPDVDIQAWYAPYACSAKALGLMRGGSDGKFHPADRLTLAELSQIAVRLMNLVITDALHEGDAWYVPAMQAVAEKQAVPPTLGHAEQTVTRGEMAQILWRLQTGVTDLPAAAAEDLLVKDCRLVSPESVARVNMDEVRRAWLGWVNGLRTSRGLTPYSFSRPLDWTAGLWAASARDKGTISHKRFGDSAYYDYGQIEQWFANLGLTFKNVDRITFTENIGWGVYRCPTDGDCTGNFIDAVRTTFDFYTSEEAGDGPHWRSLVQPNFRMLGLGIAVDPASRKYFLTVHYGTTITSNPRPVCP